MRKIILTLLMFTLLPGLAAVSEAQEKKITPIGNVTVLGTYSKVCGGNDLSGVYAGANFAPAIKLSPSDYLIPLYSGLYKKQRQIISEEEGGRLYTTTMSHNFSLLHKHLYPNLFTQRACGFVSLNYNKETSDESFGDGLYDYRDYGGYLDYQYNVVKTETNTGTLLFGGKYYFREYPNFQSLIALASTTAPEEDEKDHHAFGATSRYTYKFLDKLILSLSYDFLFKYFVDKHTIDSNGVLEDEKREDHVHFFRLDSDFKLNKKFILGLAGTIELNNSNQNYYDSDNTVGPGDDTFVPHYFDYNRYEIRPSVTWLFPLSENKNIIFKLAYAYIFRDYNNRNIKDSAGTYRSEIQEDKIHGAFLSIDFPLTQKFSFLINADYLHNTSNMEYEQYYRYDYDIYYILSGLQYKF